MSRELSCDEAEPLIVDRNEGVDLAPDTIEALDRHLEGCAECRSFATEVAQLEDEVAASPELQAQAKADAAKILAAIDDYERELERGEAAPAPEAAPAAETAPAAGAATREPRGSLWGAVVAAALVFFVAGLAIWSQPTPEPFPGIPIAGPSVLELQDDLAEERALRKQLERELELVRAERQADAREFEAQIEELRRQLEEAKND